VKNPEIDKVRVLLKHISRFPLTYDLVSGHQIMKDINLNRSPEEIAKELDAAIPSFIFYNESSDDEFEEWAETIDRIIDEEDSVILHQPNEVELDAEAEADALETQNDHVENAIFDNEGLATLRATQMNDREIQESVFEEIGLRGTANLDDDEIYALMVKKFCHKMEISHERFLDYLDGNADIDDLNDDEKLFDLTYKKQRNESRDDDIGDEIIDDVDTAESIGALPGGSLYTYEGHEEEYKGLSPYQIAARHNMRYLDPHFIDSDCEDPDPIMLSDVFNYKLENRRIKEARMKLEIIDEATFPGGIKSYVSSSESDSDFEGVDIQMDSDEEGKDLEEADDSTENGDVLEALKNSSSRHGGPDREKAMWARVGEAVRRAVDNVNQEIENIPGLLSREEFVQAGVIELSEQLLAKNLPLTKDILASYKSLRLAQYELYKLGLYDDDDESEEATNALRELYPDNWSELGIADEHTSHALWMLELMGEIDKEKIAHLDRAGRREYLEKFLIGFEEEEAGGSDLTGLLSDGGMELTLDDFFDTSNCSSSVINI
jgi:hypothetical protein